MTTEEIAYACQRILASVGELHILMAQYNKYAELHSTDRVNTYHLKDIRHGLEEIKADALAILNA